MKTHRLPLDELARLPGRALFSPSRKRDQVAYYSNHTGRFELYTLDLKSRAVRQLTDGTAPRSLRAAFVWSHDDARIIYAKDANGNEQNNLFEVELATQTVTQLNDDSTTQEYVLDAFPDNRSLLVASNRDDQQNLYRFDRVDRTWTRLTHFKSPVGSGFVSSDGEWIAFSTNESPNLQNEDGYVMKSDGSEIRRVFRVEEGSQDLVLGWHPEGRALLVQSDAPGYSRLGVLRLDDGAVLWLSDPGVEVVEAEFSQNGEWIVSLENQSAQIRPVLYAYPSGTRRDLQVSAGLASGASFVLDDAKLLIPYASANRRGEILLYDLSTDSIDVVLPAEYGSIDPAIFVGNEHVTYPSSDGKLVPAILYRPADVPAGTKVPAVIDVHGGPTSQYFRGFNSLAQLLVDQGYVVLQPNFRGSTGYGREWREANHMDWGGGDLEDVAAGVEFLTSLGIVDPDRIAIFGGSYGGYMSYIAAVKKPDLFKVAIPWVGITDLLLLYEEDMEHFKYYLRQMMGDPEQHEELWRERSAITYVDQLKTKLLMVHGVNDPRCPIRQARDFRERLIERGLREGHDFEYVELEEGHGSGGDPTGTARMFRMITDFLSREL
ncbi:MAG: S9 family peptidase [Firmicutes bacterium]|nr:S9 family peptidase [Bacillota bacterium]